METAQLRNLAMRAEGRLPATTWRDVWTASAARRCIASALADAVHARGAQPLGHRRRHGGAPPAGRRMVAVARAGAGRTASRSTPTPRRSGRGWPRSAPIGLASTAISGWRTSPVAGCGTRRSCIRSGKSREGDAHPASGWTADADRGHRAGRVVRAPTPEPSGGRAGRRALGGGELAVPGRANRGGAQRGAVAGSQPLPLRMLDDLATRLIFGPAIVEPIGFAMDRRMLAGIKERAERSRRRWNAGGRAGEAPCLTHGRSRDGPPREGLHVRSAVRRRAGLGAASLRRADAAWGRAGAECRRGPRGCGR